MDVKADNVGLVYNFHHSHEHFDRLPGLLEWMEPHLLAVNLNGMTPGAEKILPLGSGERDREMLEMIRESGYSGPIGILDHRNELDAEESLKENLEGLAKLVQGWSVVSARELQSPHGS
jgi:sugar phosphate isomerase/epimerase